MRAGHSLYTNWLKDDLLPLSDAPNPEKPFKDPNFTVELFKRIGTYSKYWRDRGYSINGDGEVVPKLEPHSTWIHYNPEIDTEFHPVNWEKIAQYLTEWKEKKQL